MIHFHSWEPWRDVLVFSFAGSYLLQGRKCRKCNNTKFGIVSTSSSLGARCESLKRTDLEEAKLWDSQG